jgi:hypothetical protein
MKVSDINHDYDNQSLNWEDHVGLCAKVARLMCHFESGLTPYHADITEDLKAKLWEALLPQNFDPDRGIRVSTYVCRCMIRQHNNICNLYLGYMPRNKYKHRNVVSMNTPVADAKEIGDFLSASEETDHGYRIDIESALRIVTDIAGEERIGKIIEYYRSGTDKWPAFTAKRKAQRMIEAEREENPYLIHELEIVLGVSA